MRASQKTMVLLVAGIFATSCKDSSPTSANARSGGAALADVAPPLPIASEPLTQRHKFTDDVSVQLMQAAAVILKDMILLQIFAM